MGIWHSLGLRCGSFLWNDCDSHYPHISPDLIGAVSTVCLPEPADVPMAESRDAGGVSLRALWNRWFGHAGCRFCVGPLPEVAAQREAAAAAFAGSGLGVICGVGDYGGPSLGDFPIPGALFGSGVHGRTGHRDACRIVICRKAEKWFFPLTGT